jgi:CylD protein
MSTIVYGGQGNLQLKHLHQMIKTKKGQEVASGRMLVSENGD